MWARLTGQSGIPAGGPAPPWWQTQTPLAADCDIALQILHCTPGEYYRRTTFAERLLMRLHLAYRHAQEEADEEYRRGVQADQDEARRLAQAQH